MLDTDPGQNTDWTFSRKVLRQNHNDRSKDIGPASFRHSHTKAERILQAELSPFTSKPVPGINKY